MTESAEVFHIPSPTFPTVIQPYSYTPYRGHGVPLIIDNGASHLRFGFSLSSVTSESYVTNLDPRVVPNIVARYKERKFNQPLLLFGDGVDAESSAKGQARTPWEGDVLLNFDALVRTLCVT